MTNFVGIGAVDYHQVQRYCYGTELSEVTMVEDGKAYQ